MPFPRPKRRTVTVALVVLATAGCGRSDKDAPPETMHFESRPDLTPPVVAVTTSKVTHAAGDIFIAPKQSAPEKGPEIIDDRGQPIWFAPVAGQATDFREQTYQGQPVLTWWEGPPDAPVDGSGVGHGVIADSSYQEIARVDSTYGPDTVDLHEFLLTPRSTALLLVYRIVPRNLTSLGGPAGGTAVDCVVEEIDVSTGSLVFIWHSLDHVPLSDS